MVDLVGDTESRWGRAMLPRMLTTSPMALFLYLAVTLLDLSSHRLQQTQDKDRADRRDTVTLSPPVRVERDGTGRVQV